jgi:DNA-binding NarL/FixJ family response regulator
MIGAAKMGNATAAARATRSWAVIAAALYLALLGVGWTLNAQAGFDGVLRPQPHEVVQTRQKILEVEPGSPADRAGVRPGDLLTAVDNNPFVYDVHQTFHDRRAGSVGSLRIVDDGNQSRVLTFPLESRLASPSILVEVILASLLGIAIMAVGAGVALARPDLGAARLLLAVALALAISAPGDLWHWTQYESIFALVLDQVSNIVWMLGAAALLHLFLVFPSPRARVARVRRALPAMYLVALLPLVLGAATSSFPVASAASTLVLTGLLLMALFALEWSYRRPMTPLARAQLAWVRWGLAVGVTATVVSRVARLLVPEAVPAVVSSVVNLAWLVFPVSIALAVLRYRLFDVDRVMRTTIIWGILVGLLVAAYLLLVVLLGRLTAGLLGASADPTLAVVAVLVFAALGHPLRVRLHSMLERAIFRQRFARSHVVEQASDLLSRPQSAETVARFLCQQAPRSLSLTGGWLVVPLTYVHVFESEARVLLPSVSVASTALLNAVRRVREPVLLAAAEDLSAYASMPTLATDSVETQRWYLAGARAMAPLRSGHGELLALWVLGAHASGDLLDREDLSAVARLAGLAEMHLERALTALAAPPTPSVVADDSLTEREREVTALLARGYSNRQIADELIIGVRTAETHVERVLRKLGLENRGQVIAWARERGVASRDSG